MLTNTVGVLNLTHVGAFLAMDGVHEEEVALTSISYSIGGGTRLQGAAYFWFFTKLMAITAVLFIPFALIYRPRTYLQE